MYPNLPSYQKDCLNCEETHRFPNVTFVLMYPKTPTDQKGLFELGGNS
jgi:hypothetical protein